MQEPAQFHLEFNSNSSSFDFTGAQAFSMDYIPNSARGQPNGVATLDASGQVPLTQLPALGLLPQIIVSVTAGSAVLCTNGETTFQATSTGTVTFQLPDYGSWTVTATLDSQSASDVITVDAVKQYPVTLQYFSATLQVTSQVGAQIDVSGPQTLTGVIPDGGMLSLTVTMPGTYVIAASLNGETTDPVSVQIDMSGQTYSVECVFYDPVLANNSWATIAKASASGKASQLWSVLDTIDIVVSGETITLEIVGFNHDELTQGGTAGITFGFKNLMNESKVMNATATNAGGYTGSDLYDFTQNTLLSQFPSDLLAVMKPVNKLTSAGSQSAQILTESMTLFSFSEAEVNGRNPNSAPGEGTQYAAFVDPNNRKKSNIEVTMRRYWTRSPAVENNTGFCFVNSGGSPFETTADTLEGICLGLCV